MKHYSSKNDALFINCTLDYLMHNLLLTTMTDDDLQFSCGSIVHNEQYIGMW